jgi:hypothetical protein
MGVASERDVVALSAPDNVSTSRPEAAKHAGDLFS